MTGARRTRRLLAILACLTLGMGTRLFPLWWSHLPATLDGFVYAGDALSVVQTGQLQLAGFRADALVSTSLLSVGSSITGITPLLLAQPLYAVLGSSGVLLGAVFARRLGLGLGWSHSRTQRAVILAAFALAVEGVYVRRTGVPDDDAITLVTIPLIALAIHTYVRTERLSWLGVATVLLVALPLTHTFSTLVAAFVIAGLLAGTFVGRPLTRGRVVVVSLFVGFCTYFAGYYTWASTVSLVVPYVDRVQGAPGLFVAWIVVLVICIPWFVRTTTTARRVTAIVPLAFVFAAIAINSVVVVFPGTAATPQLVLLLVLPLAIPALVAAVGGHWLGNDGPAALPLLALFVGPVILICYSFTAGLTPEYVATALRAQTHLHLSVVVVAAGVAARLEPPHWLRNTTPVGSLAATVRPVLLALLVIALLATLPLGYVNLDTGSYPSTTTESEFAAASYSVDHIAGQWTSSHTQVRVAGNYYDGARGAISPTASWLQGGAPPTCPVVSQRSWTTTGAHLFPAAPASTSPSRYEAFLQDRFRVYDAGGYDPTVITSTPENRETC